MSKEDMWHLSIS